MVHVYTHRVKDKTVENSNELNMRTMKTLSRSILLPRFAVAKKKTDSGGGSSANQKKHTWQQRKAQFQSVAAYRDVAGWLTAVADYATRELKKKGAIGGREQVSVARVLDVLVREAAHATWWRVRCAEMGIDEPVPDTPAPPEPPLDLELPG